jgi:transcriptional regulator with XRE-family HTH domain
MISSPQVRVARALLGWTQRMLADRAAVALNTVRHFEKGTVIPRRSTLAAIAGALVRGGIGFLYPDDFEGEGARFARPTPPPNRR